MDWWLGCRVLALQSVVAGSISSGGDHVYCPVFRYVMRKYFLVMVIQFNYNCFILLVYYTEYFNIVAGVLQGDTLAPYFFIICLDYVLRTSIDKSKKTAPSWQRKEAKGNPQKQLPKPTTLMT